MAPGTEEAEGAREGSQGLRSAGWALFAALGVTLLAASGYLAYLAASGYDLIDPNQIRGPLPAFVEDRRDALPWALASLLAGLAILVMWARDRRRAERVEEIDTARESAEAERDALRAELAAAKDALGEARAGVNERQGRIETLEDELEIVEQTWRREREWVAEMREEIRSHAVAGGLLGDQDDIPSLVLRMTIRLLDAEKGVLVSGTGGEGRRVVAWEGFENDPTESRLARRFASEVIERDTIIREDEEGLDEAPEDDSTAADREIDNLIAIPIYVSGEFSGAVVCANSADVESHDEQVLLALGNQAGAILDNASLRGELRGAYVSTVQLLAEAIKAKDPHLGGHSHEVSAYVGRVAERLGLEPREREELVFASLLHDVGKIGISERILLKPGSLTAEEYTIVKLHPRIGARLVQQVPALSPLGQYILHHHERFDGTGYPTGLRGEEIPLEARVIGIADAFSAMTSDRPYRGRMSLDEACTELEDCAGTQFDPEIVRIFVEEVRKDPPRGERANPALEALSDPEFAAVRGEEGTLVGAGPLELTDHLTLLYTHRYFHEAVGAEAERSGLQDGRFAVALFELDGIDALNRERGYAAGDEAIKAVAHAVEEAAVRCGGTACRYGGRRLGLLAPGASEDGIEAAAGWVAEGAPGQSVRTSSAVWRPGESGDDVIRRAVLGLRAAPLAD